MKLIYLHQYFTFPDNSGGTRSYDLSKKFIQNGIEVVMLTSSAKISNTNLCRRWTYIEREGIKFYILRCKYDHNMSILRRLLAFIQFVWYTSSKILTINADLVLATSTPLTVAIPALIKKWITKTPFIFEVRDVWPEGPIQQGYVKNKCLIYFLRKFERVIYQNAAYVVPLSTGMEKCIRSRVDIKNMEVIPNISEIARFSDKSNTIDLGLNFENRKIVLYAGTLGPVNDIMYVAKLAEQLVNIDGSIIFLIIGDGKQKEEIISYCESKLILNRNVFFFDPVPKKYLPYIYSLAAAGSSFVWNYKIKWDNSANKFFDTLAAGKPILINYQGWQAKVIDQYDCGYILPYKPGMDDVIKFAEYINNTILLKKQGENALKVAKSEFSLEIAVNKYLRVINHCLSK